MVDFTPKGEKQLTNTNRGLDALSELAPDADPAILVATADEISKFADAIRAMKELGLVHEVVGMIALSNGNMISIMQADELGGE